MKEKGQNVQSHASASAGKGERIFEQKNKLKSFRTKL